MTTTTKKSSKSKVLTKATAAKAGSTTRKTTAAEPSETASKAIAPVSAVSAGTPGTKAGKPTLVEGPQPVVRGPVMRKKELIDTVVMRTGIKKKDAKPVIEGMLAVLGEAMADGRELILPPMGKVIVRKEKKLPNGKVLMVKVRQSTPPIQADNPPFKGAAE